MCRVARPLRLGDRRDRPAAALIPALHKRGRNVAGLLRYLFGPGKREEHRNPHVVAAWTGSDHLAALQPPTTATGRHDLRILTRVLEQPVRAGRNPPPRPVWHASIRNHPNDRTLTHAQWAHIAGEIVAATGVAPHGDLDACRWVAVRHADDHIHIIATLVRQDGDTEWAWNDGIKAQTAARDLEHRYNLHRVAPVDRTSHRRPKPAEQNKTRRQQRPDIPRDQLRRQVRAAVAAAVDQNDFFRRLRADGVLVRLRYSTVNPGQITGYAVGLPLHHTAAGDTVWYGGGRLAPDLTLPRLHQRWTEGGSPPTRPHRRADTFYRAATVTERAARRLTDPDAPTTLAEAAADVLAATGRAMEGRKGGPLSDVVDTFDRAAREPRPLRTRRSSAAADFRSVARLISVVGRITDDDDTEATLRLLVAIAMFADNLAALREAQQRHQAVAASHAADSLRALAARDLTVDPVTPIARKVHVRARGR